MTKKFSLFDELANNLNTIEDIDNSIKITLGPTGKNAILLNKKNELKFLTSGSMLIKSLEFPSDLKGNILLKLLDQASIKTYNISGDGSTTTILFSCQLLKSSFRFIANGYNRIFISNGLKKIAFFLTERSLNLSIPISNFNQMIGVLKTSLGKKINPALIELLFNSVSQIKKDGIILVEENISEVNEVETVQGIELDKGFASSYFINDLKNFEVIYENPYLLISSNPINSLNQIREIIEFIKKNNKPLIIIAEEINKEIISTLVLNNIQKKIKVAVIKYSSIKFIKTGILEDLAILTHSNYFPSTENKVLAIEDLGQVEKAILKKNKSIFLISKFSKVIASRRTNELTREMLTSETEYEKNILKTRIARLTGNISKIKVGLSNKYQIEEERQKVESAINTLKSSLEEGIIPGGGVFYLYLREELKEWSYVNLIGEEIFAMQIVSDALLRPFEELLSNTSVSKYKILANLLEVGYPYSYDLIKKNVVHSLEEGLVDSAKSIRASLWNSLSIVSTIITSE
jgi:chaperonin GroEL